MPTYSRKTGELVSSDSDDDSESEPELDINRLNAVPDFTKFNDAEWDDALRIRNQSERSCKRKFWKYIYGMRMSSLIASALLINTIMWVYAFYGLDGFQGVFAIIPWLVQLFSK